MLSNCYEKFNANQNQTSSRRKKNNAEGNLKGLSGKEKVNLIADVLRELKNALQNAENSFGKNFKYSKKKYSILFFFLQQINSNQLKSRRPLTTISLRFL